MNLDATTLGIRTVRRLPIALGLICALTLTASAQQASPDALGSWSKVQALPLGQDMRVNAKPRSANCKFKAATADTLTCARNGVDLSFQRADIQFVKLPRRRVSATDGAMPGAILMVSGTIAFASDRCTGQFLCGLGPALVVGLGVVVAVIGTVIGALTDFAGPTIYRRP